MNSSRRLLPIVSFAFLTLAGCGGKAAAPGASAVPQAYVQPNTSRAVDSAAVSALPDESTMPAVAPDAIEGAAIPVVSGTYNGTVQGRSQGQLVARGPLQITVTQNGAHVSGNFRFELKENHGRPVVRPFDGTVAPTPDGAVLHFKFHYPYQSAPAGAWAKIDGGSFVGQGWQVPDPPYDPYEQLLFWAKAE